MLSNIRHFVLLLLLPILFRRHDIQCRRHASVKGEKTSASPINQANQLKTPKAGVLTAVARSVSAYYTIKALGLCMPFLEKSWCWTHPCPHRAKIKRNRSVPCNIISP
jgi:hypothetical protein